MLFDLAQAVAIALIVLSSCLYAFHTIAPNTSAALRTSAGRHMSRKDRPRWMQRAGRRWVRASAAPHCSCCPAQSACGPHDSRFARLRQSVASVQDNEFM